MANWKDLETQFSRRLSLGRRPVAITFLDSVPANLPRFSGVEPAGCSFWRLAAAGQTFYTVPADHFNCAVGAYTYSVQLPPERAGETEATLGMMFNLGYVRPEEIPGIPRLPKEPAAIVFAPLGDAPIPPSVALFTCKTSAALLLNEASIPSRREQRHAAPRQTIVYGDSCCITTRDRVEPRLHRKSRVHESWSR
jgi:uncharacterized protein (DUF169 family)